MTDGIPRLRMFAGPNGSGKSTIKSLLRPELLGVYINSDDIQKEIESAGSIDLTQYSLEFDPLAARSHFSSSQLIMQAGLADAVADMGIEANRLIFRSNLGDAIAYLASVPAGFIRQQLLRGQISFTFETVMSSPDKVSLLLDARTQGYRTYLYYIATEDPSINVARVRNRVKMGGHSVPTDKIVTRYARSLSLLHEAIEHTSRAYIFDNSQTHLIWIAEVTDGRLLEVKTNQLPNWFRRAVWDKFAN